MPAIAPLDKCSPLDGAAVEVAEDAAELVKGAMSDVGIDVVVVSEDVVVV